MSCSEELTNLLHSLSVDNKPNDIDNKPNNADNKSYILCYNKTKPIKIRNPKIDKEWEECFMWWRKYKEENGITIRQFLELCGTQENPTFIRFLSGFYSDKAPSTKPDSLGYQLRKIVKNAKENPPDLNKIKATLDDQFQTICDHSHTPIMGIFLDSTDPIKVIVLHSSPSISDQEKLELKEKINQLFPESKDLVVEFVIPKTTSSITSMASDQATSTTSTTSTNFMTKI